MTKPTTPLADRFWLKVDRRDPDDCWEWNAGKTAAGYGALANGSKQTVFAHRHAYELLVGSIPVGLTLDHLCRNRGCVNPKHMEPVTLAVNVSRSARYRRTFPH